MPRPQPGPIPRQRTAEDIKSTGTVHRVIRLLSAIASTAGPLRISAVARDVKLAPSTVHRLLHLLMKEGLVERTGEHQDYAVGPEFYRISACVLGHIKLSDIAQPYLDRLVVRFGETMLLGELIRAEPAMTFAARAEGGHPLQYRVQMHSHSSLLWGASGRSILAYLDEEVVSRAVARERRLGGTIPVFSELQRELQAVKRRGYAVSEGEKLPGAQGIAAPVFGARGIAGCICMTAPKGRIARDSVTLIGRTLSKEANDLSRALGSPSAGTQIARRAEE